MPHDDPDVYFARKISKSIYEGAPSELSDMDIETPAKIGKVKVRICTQAGNLMRNAMDLQRD